MSFTPKTTSTVPSQTNVKSASSVAPSKASVKLIDEFERLSSKYSAAFNESVSFPDHEFCPELVPVLRQVYKDLGMEYDPEVDSTFSLYVGEKGKYLNHFSLCKTAQDEIRVTVGGKYMTVSPDESLYSEGCRLFPGGEFDIPVVILNPKGYSLPVQMFLNLDGSNKNTLVSCSTFEDLLPFLKIHKSYRTFKELEIGARIGFLNWRVETSKKGKEYSVLSSDQGEDFFFPLNAEALSELLFPIQVEVCEDKTLSLLDSTGKELTGVKIGGKKFTKLAELAPGGYLVHSYTLGSFEHESRTIETTVLTLESQEEVTGNATINNWARGGSPEVSSDKPALLWIKAHSETKSGAVRTTCTIQSLEDLRSPFISRMYGIKPGASDQEVLDAAFKYHLSCVAKEG